MCAVPITIRPRREGFQTTKNGQGTVEVPQKQLSNKKGEALFILELQHLNNSKLFQLLIWVIVLGVICKLANALLNQITAFI